jgi:hypothetical protein
MIKEKYTFKDFLPLMVIFAVILAVAILVPAFLSSGWQMGMRVFMAGFFIVFSALKFMRIKDFVEAYQSYDLIAAKSKTYAIIYPFIELGLGLSYAFNFEPLITNWVTIVVMLISAVGVLKKLVKREKVMCACLGTVFKVPMTWVTLFEDLLMATMAAVMLSVL